MFPVDYSSTVNFSETEKFNQYLREIRNIVTTLEFKREELNESIDRLTRSLSELAFLDSQNINK